MDKPDPPRKRTLADLIASGEALRKPGATDRATIAGLTDDPLARELRILGNWREQHSARSHAALYEANRAGIDAMAETGREMARRNEAREEAQQRMVSALETMMSEALAAKRANRWMFWFTAVAAVASVVGIAASIAIAYWQKASP